MTPQPDKLFREALENFNKPASASAWDRIENGLDHRRPNGIWWKIAAGMLLLIAASFIFWPHPAAAPSITLNHDDENKSTDKSKIPIASSSEIPVVASVPATHVEFIPDKKIKSKSVHNRSIIKDDLVDIENVPNEINEEEPVVTASAPIEIIDPEPEIEDASVTVSTSKDVADETPGRNMKYTAQEVNARFIKKSVTPEATPEKNSASGIKKVIDVAIGLKNNDSLISDLRQLKNEYLTINFPDKKRDPTK